MAQSAKPYFEEADKAIARKDFPTAKEKLLQGIDLEPTNVKAAANLGALYSYEKDWNNARKWYDTALRLDPKNYQALNGRAGIYLKDGDFERGVDAYVAAAKADPNNPEPVLNLGELSYSLGDGVNAIRYFDMALKIDPTNAHAAARMAELNTMAGFPDKGAAIAESALERNPKDVDLMFAAGKAYSAKGRYLRAVDLLYDAAQLRPDDAELKYNLAFNLQSSQQLEAAADAYLEALKIDDTQARYHLQLGVTYYQMKKPKLVPLAEAEFQHAMVRNPTPSEKALASFNLAVIADDAGKPDDAMELYKAALAANPQMVEAANNVGLLYAKQSRWQESIPWYQKVLKIQPDYSPARLNLGFALIKMGDAKAGRAELQKLATLPDGDPVKAQAKQILTGKN